MLPPLKSMREVYGSRGMTHLDHAMGAGATPDVEQVMGGDFHLLLERYRLPAHYDFDASLYSVMLHLSENIPLNRNLRDWLFGRANQHYLNQTLYQAFYRVEAQALEQNFRTGSNAMDLFKACECYNKAAMMDRSLALLGEFVQLSGHKRNQTRCLYYKVQAEALHAQGNIKAALQAALQAWEHNRQEKALPALLAALYLLDEQYALSMQWLERSSLNDAQKRQEIKTQISALRGGRRICAIKSLIHLDAQKYAYLSALLPKNKKRR